MAKYYFEKENLDMELEQVDIDPDMIIRFLDWCVKYIKKFEFVKFYDAFNSVHNGGYSRNRFEEMLKKWNVFKDKRSRYKMRQMYRFLSYNREFYEYVQRNKRFDLEHISIGGLVNLYDLQNVLLLRSDDLDYYAPYVMFEICMGVMWYGLKQLKLSYDKVKDDRILDR